MAGEIVEEFGFVGIEVTDAVVCFGGSVDDVGGMMGEAGKVSAIFLRGDAFDVFAFYGVVKLKGIVGASCDQELAAVVEVEGCY